MEFPLARKMKIRSTTVTSGPNETDRQLPAGDRNFSRSCRPFRARRRRRAAARSSALRLCADAGLDPGQSRSFAAGTRPTGTGNVTAMFARGYIEVLFKTADTPLGREFDAMLARYAGVASRGLCRRRCAQPRTGGSPPSGFRVRAAHRTCQRPVETEAGDDTAAFTIARVEPGVMPEGRIQMLTHHTEAAGVAEAMAVASQQRDRPDRCRHRGRRCRRGRGTALRALPAARRRERPAARCCVSIAVACTSSATTE